MSTWRFALGLEVLQGSRTLMSCDQLPVTRGRSVAKYLLLHGPQTLHTGAGVIWQHAFHPSYAPPPPLFTQPLSLPRHPPPPLVQLVG